MSKSTYASYKSHSKTSLASSVKSHVTIKIKNKDSCLEYMGTTIFLQMSFLHTDAQQPPTFLGAKQLKSGTSFCQTHTVK